MFVTLVHVQVKAEHLDSFIRATTENLLESVKEPGNLRFDVLQCSDDPRRFVLYEAYKSAEDATAHKETAHYLKWKETVVSWMAKPREGIRYTGLQPEF